MQTAQACGTTYRTTRQKANVYRNARVSGEVTIGLTSTPFATINREYFADMVKWDNLLVDMLVKAAIISQSDAASARYASPSLPVVDYLKCFCNQSEATCSAFLTLMEKVWSGKLTLDQAAVAANHLYIAHASVAEAVRLVKWAGQ
jgi:hypothetical protein